MVPRNSLLWGLFLLLWEDVHRYIPGMVYQVLRIRFRASCRCRVAKRSYVRLFIFVVVVFLCFFYSVLWSIARREPWKLWAPAGQQCNWHVVGSAWYYL